MSYEWSKKGDFIPESRSEKKDDSKSFKSVSYTQPITHYSVIINKDKFASIEIP